MPSTLQSLIRDVIGRHGEIRFAMLFGSIADGNERSDSDIDLAVQAERPLTAAQKMTLIEDLAERTGRPVDLLDLSTVGVPLLGQILKSGVRLVGTTSQYAALIRKHVFDNTDFMPYRRRILESRRSKWIGN